MHLSTHLSIYFPAGLDTEVGRVQVYVVHVSYLDLVGVVKTLTLLQSNMRQEVEDRVNGVRGLALAGTCWHRRHCCAIFIDLLDMFVQMSRTKPYSTLTPVCMLLHGFTMFYTTKVGDCLDT